MDESACRWIGSHAHQWFEMMRKCGDESPGELLHDGCPVACLGDAPFGYVNVFTSHVNVGFFHGAALQDPARLLEGSGMSESFAFQPVAPGDYFEFGQWKAPANFKIEFFVVRVGEWGGHMLMDCDDPLTIHKFCSMLPALVFQVHPVVRVEDAFHLLLRFCE